MPRRRVLTVSLTGGYWLHSIKGLLRDLRPLFDLIASGKPAVVNVDMRRLTFMSPAALATTVATLMTARDGMLTLEGGKLFAPEAPGMRRYLHRMDFFNVLFHELEIPDPSERSEAAALLECQHFMEDDELRGVMKGILSTIEQKTTIDRQARTALDTCLSEVLENVIYHADSRFGGVAAVQAFRNNELEVAIVDLGVGVPTSLAKNPEYEELARKDDLTAVKTALVPNVTSTPWRNKGWGLAFTELLLGINEGRLVVRSGAGVVTRGANSSDRLDAEQPFPGTLVAMRIKTDRPLDYSRAWELLDEAIDTVYAHGDGDARRTGEAG